MPIENQVKIFQKRCRPSLKKVRGYSLPGQPPALFNALKTIKVGLIIFVFVEVIDGSDSISRIGFKVVKPIDIPAIGSFCKTLGYGTTGGSTEAEILLRSASFEKPMAKPEPFYQPEREIYCQWKRIESGLW